jgi:hypothetical protein
MKRYSAALDGDFVVFLIGMQIRKPWAVHTWLPVFVATRQMLRELTPADGLLGLAAAGARQLPHREGARSCAFLPHPSLAGGAWGLSPL